MTIATNSLGDNILFYFNELNFFWQTLNAALIVADMKHEKFKIEKQSVENGQEKGEIEG